MLNSRLESFFDDLAPRWDETAKHDPIKLRDIFTIIDLKKGDAVLDVGTGTGVILPLIGDAVGNTGAIDAVDISSQMLGISKSKNKNKNITFIHADATTLDVKSNYDAIICYSMFPHFDNKCFAIDKLSLMLKLKGKLVICHSQSRNDINSMHKKAGQDVNKDLLPSGEEVAKMMIKSGLKILKVVDSHEIYLVMGEKPDVTL